MRFIPTLTLFLGAATTMAAQESPLGIPLEKTGAEAQAAFDAWSTSVTPSWDYPVQMHVETHLGIDLGVDGAEFHVEVGFMVEVLHESPDVVRSWGSGMLIFEGLDIDLNWLFEYQAESNKKGLRMTMKDNRAFSQEFMFHLPSAYTLSPDRLHKAVSGFNNLLYTSMDQFTDEEIQPLDVEHGTFGMYHPATLARMIGTYPTSIIVGWGKKDGQVLVQTAPNPTLIDNLVEAGAPGNGMDFSNFKNIVYTMSFDEKSGSLLAYTFDESLPLDGLAGPEVPVTGKLVMTMNLKQVPVSEEVPVVTFPEEETVLDCNVPFDKYWALLEMGIELQKLQEAAEAEEAEADEDFDF